jgi:ribosomal protein S18 acetylase RimI-like enzyme
MITVERFSNQTVDDNFVKLFDDIFGFYDPTNRPTDVYLASDDSQTVGFLSGYMKGSNHFYCQYAGLILEYQGKGFGKEEWGKVVEQILKEVDYMSAAVDNRNVAAIKILLDTGFTITGCRQNLTNGGLLVEMTKWRTNHG